MEKSKHLWSLLDAKAIVVEKSTLKVGDPRQNSLVNEHSNNVFSQTAIQIQSTLLPEDSLTCRFNSRVS